MPNHFHLMVYVHTLEIDSGSTTLSRTTTNKDTASPKRNFNKSLGVLLTSYTRAINLQENRTGSLFKPHTKAECITKLQGITPAFFGSHINVRIPENEYPS